MPFFIYFYALPRQLTAYHRFICLSLDQLEGVGGQDQVTSLGQHRGYTLPILPRQWKQGPHHGRGLRRPQADLALLVM